MHFALFIGFVGATAPLWWWETDRLDGVHMEWHGTGNNYTYPLEGETVFFRYDMYVMDPIAGGNWVLVDSTQSKPEPVKTKGIGVQVGVGAVAVCLDWALHHMSLGETATVECAPKVGFDQTEYKGTTLNKAWTTPDIKPNVNLKFTLYMEQMGHHTVDNVQLPADGSAGGGSISLDAPKADPAIVISHDAPA